ncbi:MAG: DUF1573 domain-containing protein [Proteobacteria bacterium]|nr:DUF1573 domain-containing protein [Pseudomonadota bacterium]
MKTRALLVALLALLAAACSRGGPDIEVAGSYDMGSVAKGARAVAELPVLNRGDRPLTIVAVSTSCGCTRATLTPMTIPPGGQGRLRIEYDSAAHEADRGRIERSVFISSDDPNKQDVRIRVTVFVDSTA